MIFNWDETNLKKKKKKKMLPLDINSQGKNDYYNNNCYVNNYMYLNEIIPK